MAICEKCWGDAYLMMLRTGDSRYDCYKELLAERKDNPCSREEQRGQETKTTDALKEGG